jgi:hypothetical protein
MDVQFIDKIRSITEQHVKSLFMRWNKCLLVFITTFYYLMVFYVCLMCISIKICHCSHVTLV